MKFKLESKYKPSGDQPKAIKELVKGLDNEKKEQVLLGATGTGKTFTIANVIEKTNQTTLVLSHNKTLAAQIYSELREFFPKNKVEYFISNFDYYRPEAYLPSSDTYIDKTSKSNWDIEAMRMSTANSLLSGEPTIVVASVASIYGQLKPEEYLSTFLEVIVGQKIDRNELLESLISRNYDRNNLDPRPGTFRARGDVVDIIPGHDSTYMIRIEFFGDEIEAIKIIDDETGEVLENPKKYTIFPGDAYTTKIETIKQAVKTIEKELNKRIMDFKKDGKLLEAQRIEQRTKQDMEALLEYGVCSGIENYSSHLDKRKAGIKPYTILDYLQYNTKLRNQKPLLVIDESHMMIPQLRAMYAGDRSRKENLVKYGFRLPSALDNRPLQFEEFESFDFNKIYVSATPANFEIDRVHGEVVSQIIRPTGLLDPTIEVEKELGMSENIYDRIQNQKLKHERTLILTTTKRMAEELTKHLQEKGEKVAYIHSDFKTFERQEILRKLRLGIYDTVIGINLLREGIDLPEVSLILIVHAGRESFFRSTSSLIQIIGRAARNSNGHVVMYADNISKSMSEAISETKRRRKIQENYNKNNNIVPKTIKKSIPEPIQGRNIKGAIDLEMIKKSNQGKTKKKLISSLRGQMLNASKQMNFERAMQLRDLIIELDGDI